MGSAFPAREGELANARLHPRFANIKSALVQNPPPI